MIRAVVNAKLDSVAWPERNLFHRRRCSFRLCGYTGLGFAIVLATTMAMRLGLSVTVTAAIVAVASLAFLGLVMATKIVTGEENIVYYHHEIAVVLMASVLLLMLREPVLPYLDVTILGIGTFLAFGRIGCFMAGCCHGRPCHWGVCYRQEHADAGFTPYYVGVRLFPIQLVESLWVLATVIVGSYFVIGGHQPGTALAWYVVSYDLGRFIFEFMRGDAARPYLWGFSQPQWISVILLWGVAAAEVSGTLPLHRWHVGAAAGLTLAMVAIALKRRFERVSQFHLSHPRHVREIAEIVDPINAGEALTSSRWTVFPRPAPTHLELRVGCTSLGIRVSASTMRVARQSIEHFGLSQTGCEMSEDSARSVAEIIGRLRSQTSAAQLIRGDAGVFHLLIRQAV